VEPVVVAIAGALLLGICIQEAIIY